MDQERELAARAAVRAGEATGSEHWSRSAQAHFASLRFDEPAAALVVAAGPAAEGGGDCASFQLVNDGMREAEAEAAGFIRKASYPLAVAATNMRMTTVRHFKLHAVTADGLLHFELCVNQWDTPPLAQAPATATLSLAEATVARKAGVAELEHEAAVVRARDEAQEQRLERLAGPEAEASQRKLDASLARTEATRTAQGKQQREAEQAKLAAGRNAGTKVREEHRREVESDMQTQMAALQKQIDAALAHPVWQTAEHTKKMETSMETELQASVASEAGDEGGRQYFEVIGGLEEVVRTDLDARQRTATSLARHHAECLAEVAAIHVVKLAGSTYESLNEKHRHAVAAVVVGDILSEVVSTATSQAAAQMEQSKAERDAEAQRFLREFEEQQRREAERELAVVMGGESSGRDVHHRPAADPGASYLARLRARSTAQRRSIANLVANS